MPNAKQIKPPKPADSSTDPNESLKSISALS